MQTAPRRAERSDIRLSADLLCVDPKQNAEFWPYVEPLLRPAIENVGLSDFDEFAADVLRGDALLWLAVDGGKIKAAASTVLRKIGQDKVCVLTACGGHGMHEWLPLIEKIEAFAHAEGCKSLRIYGREGWARALEGYRKMAIVIEKEFA
jgi:hypothetical protein